MRTVGGVLVRDRVLGTKQREDFVGRMLTLFICFLVALATEAWG